MVLLSNIKDNWDNFFWWSKPFLQMNGMHFQRKRQGFFQEMMLFAKYTLLGICHILNLMTTNCSAGVQFAAVFLCFSLAQASFKISPFMTHDHFRIQHQQLPLPKRKISVRWSNPSFDGEKSLLLGGWATYPSEKWWTTRQLGWFSIPNWMESLIKFHGSKAATSDYKPLYVGITINNPFI